MYLKFLTYIISILNSLSHLIKCISFKFIIVDLQCAYILFTLLYSKFVLYARQEFFAP